LATTLRRLRRSRGLSQRALVAPLHLGAHSTIADYESGRRIPPTDVLRGYEKVFALPSGELGRLRDRALAERAEAEDQPLASRLRPTVPHQLPADVDDFTGRESVVDRACALARAGPERPALVVVSGVGGVGKTALAVHVAHRLRDEFPDGQLYLRLRGSGSVALSTEDALGQLLRGVGNRDSAIPDGVDERSARYRSLIVDRRLLLVLDDASSAAQVRPLLPGTPSCSVLVTSRNRLVGLEGARRLILEPLEPAEAQALLTRILGSDRTATQERAVQTVARLCGYLPLALRIVAARLAARPHWTITDMVDRLADRRQLFDELVADDLDVRTTFELTYCSLTSEQARVFRLLAASDLRDLPVLACAALVGVAPATAEAMAESLVDLHLLESTHPGRYRQHDLLRLFASAKVEQDPSRRDAVDRLHTAYRSVLRSAAQRTRPGLVAGDGSDPNPHFVDADAARQWLDLEHASVVTLILEAARTAESSVHVATDLLRDIQGTLRTAGHWHEWEEAARGVLEAANRTGDDRAALVAHQHLGQIATLRGRLDDADDELNRALVLAHYLHDSAAAASVLNRLGLLESARSRLRPAIACHELAYQICMSVGDRRGTYIALTNLGKCRVDNHDPTGAIDAIQLGMALAEEARDEDAMTLLLHHKANAQAALGRHDEAIRTHLGNLALIRKRGQREGEAWTLAQLGRAYLAVNRPDDAARSLEASLAIFEALGATVATQSCLVDLGRALLRLNRPEHAGATLRRARDLLEPSDTSLRSEVDALLVQAGSVPARALDLE
jgi:tetratricopeptide (TPR) repeat protein/transcriptional regulator with XRE-family HTH domain